MNHPTAPPLANFDRVARLYRWAEYLSLGPLLQRTRTHFLPQLTGLRRAVLFGDGDGRFLAALLRQNPQMQATAVDTSSNMLQLLSARCPAAEIVKANALTHTPAPDTDLIVTHFFLDCLTQPQVDQLAQGLAAQITPGSLWLLSDFRIPTGPLGPLARAYIRALYFAFRGLTGLRVTRLPDPQSALNRAGFHCLAAHRLLGGILYTELWRLKPLRATTHSSSLYGTQPTATLKEAHMSDQQPTPPLPNPKDALPNPEPIAPSLATPDPGVFHHEVPPAKPHGETSK